MADATRPRWVHTRAPVRVLDAGGWTDTWFAMSGNVCNLAVGDGVDVIVERTASGGASHTGTVALSVPSLAEDYEFSLEELPGRHPLLEATLRRWAPSGVTTHVTVAPAVPPGAGMGTSASVVVAVIAALDALGDRTAEPASLATAAHEIETVELGLQSGVQDQIAATRGGGSFITIGPYPETDVRVLELTPATWEALTTRVVTVYLNAPHRSGALHEMVIRSLETRDKETLFAPLRAAAHRAADALVAGDLGAYGDAMVLNTDAQAALHPALVSTRAREVIGLAQRHGAVGWKVNGAGGDGGTVTIVTPEDPAEIRHALDGWAGVTVLPLCPTRHGVRIIDHD